MPTSLQEVAKTAKASAMMRRRVFLKSPVRENRTPGSVQWRGTDEEGNKRKPDIETIYGSLDAQTALTLMDKYGIKYVYVGSLERSHYPSAALDKFDYIMEVVYQQGAVTIYKRR